MNSLPLTKSRVALQDCDPKPCVDRSLTTNVTDYSSSSLEDLIAAISEKRDKRAFVELFKQTSPRLKAFAMQCGANVSDAEEIVQECMLNVWRKAHTFKPKSGTAITWLYTIIRNRRIDFARKNRHETVSSDDMWLEESGDELESQVHHDLSGEKARSLLDALPNEQKQVVYKVYFEGKPHSEISKDLELPLGTIKSRLRLAMNKLEILAKEQMSWLIIILLTNF